MQDVSVTHRAYVAVPVSRVFEVLTTAEGWCGWFAAGAIVEPHEGGAIQFEWQDFGPDHFSATDHGRVVEVVENRRFSFTWSPASHETLVTFDLEQRAAGCLLSVHETGYGFNAADVETALQVAVGWGEALTLLKFHLEHGIQYGTVPRE